MITKFKLFEEISILPKVNDYVIINKNEYQFKPKMWLNFISSNIGQIIDIQYEHGGTSNIYTIKFENVPEDIQENYLYQNKGEFKIEKLKYWTPNKNELEILLNSNKYNI